MKDINILNLEIQFNKALYLLKLGKIEKAREDLFEIVTVAKTNNLPLFIKANCVLGDLFFLLEKYEKSKHHLLEVVNTSINDDLDDLLDYEKSRAFELLAKLEEAEPGE